MDLVASAAVQASEEIRLRHSELEESVVIDTVAAPDAEIAKAREEISRNTLHCLVGQAFVVCDV